MTEQPIQWNLPRHFQQAIPREILADRLRDLQRRLGEKGGLVLYAAGEKLQSHSVHFPFRQDSDFYYLTGLNITPARLIVTGEHFWIFSDEPDPEKEVWEGVRPRQAEIRDLSLASEVFSLSEFPAKFDEALKGRSRLFFPFGQDPVADRQVFRRLDTLIRRARAGQSGPTGVFHTHVLLHEMRMIKSPWEIDRMRDTAGITEEAHRNIQAMVRPGMREYELEAEILRCFVRRGSVPSYPSIVATGANACVLHYVKNDAEIRAGDLILVDAGAAKNGLHSDVTRTFPADGAFRPEQKAAYEAVLRAQQAAIGACIVGGSMDDAHHSALVVLVEFLRAEGLLSESVETCIEQQLYRPFYMHRTGHWIGYDVHDVGAYYGGQEWIEAETGPRRFRAGMVCTVEPGLYFSPGMEAAKHFRGIGIRIEDDVLITPGEPSVLTAAIPKTMAEIARVQSDGGKRPGTTP